ncbi:hypothetical protein FOC35_19310 [Cedecea sp. FDAARGOS_727]|nr:hypothetical protein [Cedecea sp. FDAARGOS_727]QIX94178.1 hypothetical protein FOC35_19310 [Cedecea sp. FDAARGOS_727]
MKNPASAGFFIITSVKSIWVSSIIKAVFPFKKISKIVTTISVKTLGELCDLWLSIKETELAANTLRKTVSQIETLKYVTNKSTPATTIRYSDILNYRNTVFALRFYAANA